MTAQTNGHFEVLELPNLQDSITIFNNVEEKSISSQTELVILSQSPARAMSLSAKNLTTLIFHLFVQVENNNQLLELKDMWVK